MSLKCLFGNHMWLNARTLIAFAIDESRSQVIKSQWQCENCELCAMVDFSALPPNVAESTGKTVFYK